MKEQCIHHWFIDSQNVGRCKKCPEVKDFGAMHTKASAAMERKVQTIRLVLRKDRPAN